MSGLQLSIQTQPGGDLRVPQLSDVWMPFEERLALELESFFTYTLHHTQLHSFMLALFHCLKEHFPDTWGSSDPRIFLFVYMLASKITQRRP